MEGWEGVLVEEGVGVEVVVVVVVVVVDVFGVGILEVDKDGCKDTGIKCPIPDPAR